ncbi:MAG: hypothetical protein A3K54_03805 [Omnitrophica WOR_2 bacterium RBG_13_44_8]|nr:MAG: hypothetical protein A3K54_03805 [Omnitrophica WOR_2 bacterium RBG_13_44_8]
MIVARILGKGQIVIPKEVRKKVNLSPGDKVEVRLSEEGIIISPIQQNYTENFKGIIKGKLSLEDLERLHAEES